MDKENIMNENINKTNTKKENKQVIFVNEMEEKAYNHLGVNESVYRLSYINRNDLNEDKIVSKNFSEEEFEEYNKNKNIPVIDIEFSEELNKKINEKDFEIKNIILDKESNNLEYVNIKNKDIFVGNLEINAKNEEKNILIELDENKEENKISDEKRNSSSNKLTLYRDLNINIKAKNSRVNIIYLVKNTNTFSLDNINIVSKEKSVINFKYIILGESKGHFKNISNVYKDSKINISGIYFLKNKDFLNFMFLGNLEEEKAESYFNLDGIMEDGSFKISKDILNFKNGAKGSVGIEKEDIVILSDDAKAKTAPILLSKEEDIIGEHGYASGSLDKNKLFYLNSRGLSYDDAKYIIILSKIEKNFKNIFENIEDEILDEKIEEIKKYIKENI